LKKNQRERLTLHNVHLDQLFLCVPCRKLVLQLLLCRGLGFCRRKKKKKIEERKEKKKSIPAKKKKKKTPNSDVLVSPLKVLQQKVEKKRRKEKKKKKSPHSRTFTVHFLFSSFGGGSKQTLTILLHCGRSVERAN